MCTAVQSDETRFCPRLEMTERFLPVPQGPCCDVISRGASCHCAARGPFVQPKERIRAARPDVLLLEGEGGLLTVLQFSRIFPQLFAIGFDAPRPQSPPPPPCLQGQRSAEDDSNACVLPQVQTTLSFTRVNGPWSIICCETQIRCYSALSARLGCGNTYNIKPRSKGAAHCT